MKKIITILLCLYVASFAHAGELKLKGYIKPDPIRGHNHFVLFDDAGNAKARIKPDPIWSNDSGRYIIIDKDGNESGRIRPDYLNKDQYNFETVRDD